MHFLLARRARNVCAAVLLLLLGLFFTVQAISNTAFSALEVRETNANVVRVKAALAARLDGLGSVANDWGTWDDAYRVLLGQNPGFADANMNPSSLQALRLNVMALVTEDGRVLEGRGVDVESGRALAFPGSLRTLLATRPSYAQLSRIGQTSAGLIALPEGLLLFTTRAVTDSAGVKPPNGVILVGRFLDAEEVDAIAEQTGLDVTLYTATQVPALPAAVRSAFASGSSSGTVAAASSPSTMTGSIVLPDAAGSPAAVLMVRFPRAIYRAGQNSMLYFAVALSIFGVFTLGVVIVALVRQSREVLRRQRAQDAQRASEEQYRLLINNMADAVFGLTSDGTIVFANPQASALTGHPNDALLGMHYSQIVRESGSELVEERMPSERGRSVTFETEMENTSGRSVPVELSATATGTEPAGGIAVQWIARDITERKRHETQLVYLAEHDFLTGLMNRRRVEEEIDHALERSRRSRRSGAFLWLDVDAFKDVNDRFGHRAGDDVLIDLAGLLSRELRADSELCRLGGDEFGILLHDADAGGACIVAERLLSRIRKEEFLFSGQHVHVTGSIGISLFPDHASTTEELMAHADAAAYAAKQEDRGRYRLYRPDEDWDDELSSRFEWSARIERALAEDRFLVYAQPIIDLSDSSVDRYELLIRLQGEGGEIIPPDSFLPIAERVGLIHQVDRWMVRHAIELLAGHNIDARLRLDVNLSGKVLSDSRIVSLIDAELSRSGVDPARLGVEITETVAIFDMNKARALIVALKDIGCRVTLDDFGSGFSSFYYLNNLPIDGLKIDGAFVKEMKASPKNQHIVRAMVELCGGFGIASTGEWVEDAQTLGLLGDYGVTYAQGFAIGRPLPAEEAFARGGATLGTAGDASPAPGWRSAEASSGDTVRGSG